MADLVDTDDDYVLDRIAESIYLQDKRLLASQASTCKADIYLQGKDLLLEVLTMKFMFITFSAPMPKGLRGLIIYHLDPFSSFTDSFEPKYA